MGEIYMDIEKFRNAAEKLRKISIDLGNVEKSMAAIMGSIGDFWQGFASDAFLEVNNWTIKEMESLRFDMEDLVSDIEKAIIINE